jgi:hypothetical protein
LLLLNYSTSINWRYFLTGLPALAPIVASYFMRSQTVKLGSLSRAFLSVVVTVVAIAIILGIYLKPSRDRFTAQHAAMKEYRSRLGVIPQDAIVIPGSQSIAVTYWRGIGAGNWSVIGAGSGWPGAELASVIETHLSQNRRVVLDADPRFWSPCGWQEAETRELVELEKRFRFRRISDAIFEVRPLTDSEALDAPNLRGLLPENRLDEVERCKGQGKLS